MVKVRVNAKPENFTAKLADLRNKLDTYRNSLLSHIADDLTMTNPVSSGTYATSHEATTGSPSGRSSSSEGKPRGQDVNQFRDKGRSKLESEIDSLPENPSRVRFSNYATHNDDVELKYNIYGIARNRLNIHKDSARVDAGLDR